MGQTQNKDSGYLPSQLIFGSVDQKKPKEEQKTSTNTDIKSTNGQNTIGQNIFGQNMFGQSPILKPIDNTLLSSNIVTNISNVTKEAVAPLNTSIGVIGTNVNTLNQNLASGISGINANIGNVYTGLSSGLNTIQSNLSATTDIIRLNQLQNLAQFSALSNSLSSATNQIGSNISTLGSTIQGNLNQGFGTLNYGIGALKDVNIAGFNALGSGINTTGQQIQQLQGNINQNFQYVAIIAGIGAVVFLVFESQQNNNKNK